MRSKNLNNKNKAVKENLKFTKISTAAITLSLISFAVTLLVGATMKRLQVTLTLLYLPIIFSITSLVTSTASLVKKESKKKLSIIILVLSIVYVFLFIFLLSVLKGLSMFT